MKQFIIIFALIVCGASLWAQSDSSINKNVIVVREYNPTISDANKINLSPEIKDPEINSPVFNYTFFVHPLQSDFEIIPLSPATLAPEPKRSYDQNYISAGFGNYSSLYGELFYRAFQSDKHSLVFNASNASSFGKIKLEDGNKSNATFVKNRLNLAYKKQFWSNYFKADLNFSNYNYRYYGYQTVNMDTVMDYVYFADDTTSVNNKNIHGTSKPGYASFKANFLFASNPTIYDEMAYKAELFYDHFYTRIGLSEDVIGLNGMFEYPIEDNAAGGDVQVLVGLYNTPSDTTLVWNFDNFTSVAFSPYFKLNRQAWNLKLGINSYFMFGQGKTKYLVTPDIALNFKLIEDYFSAYVKAGGDYHINDYRSVIAQNPYITPELNVTPTRVPLTLEAGLKGQLAPKLMFNGGVKFAIIENHPFYVNEFFRDSITQVSTSTFSNQFIASYDDMNVLTVEAAIDYAGTQKYSFGASGVYHHYSPENFENVWHLPSYELKVYGSYVPYKNVRVNGSFTSISERKALVETGTNVTDIKTLKAVYDLSFSGEYSYNNRLSGFLKLNNVLGSKYYTWNGYPSFGFNMMIGARYTF